MKKYNIEFDYIIEQFSGNQFGIEDIKKLLNPISIDMVCRDNLVTAIPENAS